MKKNLFYIIGGVVLAIIIAALVIFIIKTSGQGTEPFAIEGTWKIHTKYDKAVEGEYLVFEGDTVKAYRNGQEILNTTYEWTKDGSHIVLDTDKLSANRFFIKKHTDNHIILVEPGDTDSSKLRWELVRVADKAGTFDKASIKGEWIVIWHAGRAGEAETIVFDDTNMKDYVNGELKLDATYVWDEFQENTFYIEKMNDYFTVYRTDADTVILIQKSINGIWEIQAK